MKDPSKNDTLDGLLRSIDENLSRLERHTHRPIGPTGPSGDYRNWAGPGSDDRVYINSVIASVTPPTYVDFGGGIIPVGAVWLELGERPIEGGWCDDFERSLLGPDWTDGPVWYQPPYEITIANSLSGGALIAGENSEDYPVTILGSVRTTAAWPGDQTIEVIVSDFFQGHDPAMGANFQWVEGENYLFTQVVGGTSNACIGVYVVISAVGTPEAYAQLFTMDADGIIDFTGDEGGYPLGADWEDNLSYVLRLETTVAGHCKFFVEGELIFEGDATPTGGEYIGMAQQWNRTNYLDPPTVPNNGTSPRYEEVCINMPPGTPA